MNLALTHTKMTRTKTHLRESHLHLLTRKWPAWKLTLMKLTHTKTHPHENWAAWTLVYWPAWISLKLTRTKLDPYETDLHESFLIYWPAWISVKWPAWILLNILTCMNLARKLTCTYTKMTHTKTDPHESHWNWPAWISYTHPHENWPAGFPLVH